MHLRRLAGVSLALTGLAFLIGTAALVLTPYPGGEPVLTVIGPPGVLLAGALGLLALMLGLNFALGDDPDEDQGADPGAGRG